MTQIDGVRSVFLFEGVTREAIHHLKYRGLKALASPLGSLLADYLHSHPLPAQVLVPVPLHPRRLRQRGYNQSALLSRELSKSVNLPLVEGCLVRLRNTAAQARAADAEERKGNVEGAFECRDERLGGKQVLLIDDVCTTGATLASCASALKAKGAVSVWGLTLAREI
jgi:ComF family protein